MTPAKQKLVVLAVVAVVASALLGATLIRAQEQEQAQENPIFGPRYLYIEEFEIGTGQSVNEAIAEGAEWVKGMRKTGEFSSVRLYVHHTGPRAAIYILAEAESWPALGEGFEKFIAGDPSFLDEKWKFGSHSDNLLSEVEVK